MGIWQGRILKSNIPKGKCISEPSTVCELTYMNAQMRTHTNSCTRMQIQADTHTKHSALQQNFIKYLVTGLWTPSLILSKEVGCRENYKDIAPVLKTLCLLQTFEVSVGFKMGAKN